MTPADTDLVHAFRATVREGGVNDIAVSFAHGWEGAAAVAAAVAEARANPGRPVTLLAARHPRSGGDVELVLTFAVVDDRRDPWHGSVRTAASSDGHAPPSPMAAGTERLADAAATDAEVAATLAMRLARAAPCVFRPLPEQPAARSARGGGSARAIQ